MAPSSADLHAEFSFRTRQASWDFLKANPTRPLNLLIVGGGIVGAGALRAAALRGIQDAILVEKNDFASGTSGASSKLIHAGIRYLEIAWLRLKSFQPAQAWGSFRFVVQASRERKILGRMAPHLVKPKPVYFVLGADDERGAAMVFFGVWFYYLIQIFQGQFFSPPRFAFRGAAIKRLVPDLKTSRVKAVFRFWDSETDDARLVIENLQDASARGARALNYVQMVRYAADGGRIAVDLRNGESGETISVLTKILINAGGPFVDDIRDRATPASPRPRLVDRVEGAHIDVYPAFTRSSYYMTASDARLVFVLTRNEDGLRYTRIGTTERPLADDEPSDHPRASAQEVAYLTSLVQEFFPSALVTPENSLRIDAGIRPLRRQQGAEAFLKSREHDIVREGNVFHVVGVKLTDYRRVATELMSLLPLKALGIRAASSSRDNAPLRRGANERLYAEPSARAVIDQTMVIHWDDFVFRRRGLAPRVDARFNRDAFEKEFHLCADAFGWDAERQSAERRRVDDVS